MKGNILKETLLFSATSVLGPVFLFGGIGYFLDSYLNTNKVFTLSAIGVAFVVTQVLMFRKIKKEYSKISLYEKESDSEESNGVSEKEV